MNRVLLIAGASGGHLMPVIAVSQELRAMDAATQIHVACVRPEDADIVRQKNFDCSVLPIIRSSWKLPWILLKNLRAASRLIAAFRPDVIFSKGGAAGLPLLWLAHRRGIPIILHESDAVMGRANRFAARFATTICLGFPPKYEIQNTKYVVTGNPIRSEIFKGSRAEGLRITGFTGKRPILLVMGGSQGALAINRAIDGILDAILEHYDVIHVSGPGKSGAHARRGYWTCAFANEELPHLYACTSLAVSRAGAASISELAAWGIPAILVPLRGLAQDHQTANAMIAEQTAGCVLLQQEMLHEKLLPVIRQILHDPSTRDRMTRGMRSLSHPAAARHISEIIAQVLAGRVEAA